MEGILKRRYPNSLPALILAASAAGDSVDRNTVDFMERRIKKLEADLEGKDEEAKKSLRTMEQQFQKMKVMYRVAEMEAPALALAKHSGHPCPPVTAYKRSLSPSCFLELHQPLLSIPDRTVKYKIPLCTPAGIRVRREKSGQID